MDFDLLRQRLLRFARYAGLGGADRPFRVLALEPGANFQDPIPALSDKFYSWETGPVKEPLPAGGILEDFMAEKLNLSGGIQRLSRLDHLVRMVHRICLLGQDSS